ncbi:potassium channel subfamily T member 2-like isoform X8 [Symsagittifera roscoffensis]|uniref:potassium channel subfamily T member 2-like isoform X8 n=1 Tax=Symsagittifera roscoffensis TaxID=84072 RepID=UPI00307CB299
MRPNLSSSFSFYWRSTFYPLSMFGIHYLERANDQHQKFSIANSLWFVVVTFSTVGYGEFVPSWVPSRMFVAVTICAALMVIPIQLEKMAFYWRERQKQGGTYSSHRAETEKHVILCATYLSSDVLMDFLNEFYAHPALQTYFVVLLSPSELDATIKMILQVPLWSQRVIYIQGSALKDQDLVRAKADMAQCCFILASRNEADRNKADQATILRTWAVKDFSPMCPLFVQILRPENKFHISFADHIVCEEELKYALLANNCVIPAVSTLTTLLLHTLKGRQKSNSREEWERDYSHSSGQEIYHKRLRGSLFFGEYVDANFSFAAFHAHKKYGITLIGVQPKGEDAMLNPGPSHIMSESDICYYINTTKEEQSSLVAPKKKGSRWAKVSSLGMIGGRGSSRGDQVQMTEKQIRRELIEAADLTDSNSDEDIISFGTNAALNTNQIPRCRARASAVATPTDNFPSGGTGGLLVGGEVSSPQTEPEEHTTDPHNQNSGSTHPISGVPLPTIPNGRVREPIRASTNSITSLTPHQSHGAVAGGSTPGPDHIPTGTTQSPIQCTGGGANLALPLGVAMRGRRASIMPVSDECLSNNIIPDTDDGEEIPIEEWQEKYSVSCGLHPSKYMKGYPAILPYTGFWSPQVYLIPDLNTLQPCCLNITLPCLHRPTHLRSAMDHNFPSKFVLIAAEYPTLALFNFVVPLRSHCRPRYALNPVVLLLEQEPDAQFLEAMTCYPMVYYALGNIERLDDVLRAGICRAEAVVIVGKESSKTAKEEYMADSQTIVAVQTLCKLFPAVSVITELTHPSNMRFMRFHASERFDSLHLTNKEKKTEVLKAKREGSTLTSYLYRKPFAAGHVFSASMLDTLLYQAFVKPYIVGITNLFLGLQQNDKSGHLFSMQITEKELWIRTYGRLFQRLCSTTYEIPIGIYRYCSEQDDFGGGSGGKGGHVEITFENDSDSDFGGCDMGGYPGEGGMGGAGGGGSGSYSHHHYYQHYDHMEKERLDETVRQRMEQLGMKPKALSDFISHNQITREDKRSRHSYVIINPDYDFSLKVDDIIYLIRPPKPNATPIPQRRRLPPKPINFRRASIRRCSVSVSHVPGGNTPNKQNQPNSSHHPLNYTGSNTLAGFGGRSPSGSVRSNKKSAPGALHGSQSAASSLASAVLSNHVVPNESSPPSVNNTSELPNSLQEENETSFERPDDSSNAHSSRFQVGGSELEPNESYEVPTIIVRSPSPVMPESVS